MKYQHLSEINEMNTITEVDILNKLTGFTNQELYWIQNAWLEFNFNEEQPFDSYEECLNNISHEFEELYRYPNPLNGWLEKQALVETLNLDEFYKNYLQVKNDDQTTLIEAFNTLNDANYLMALEHFNNRYEEPETNYIHEGNLFAEVNNSKLYEQGKSESNYSYKIYRESDQFIGIIEGYFDDGSKCRYLEILRTTQEIFDFFGEDMLAFQLYACAQINVETYISQKTS
jgi:hypothetical protein